MTKDPSKLDRIQDTVYADPTLEPKDGETFCNVAVDRVATAYGCTGLHDAVTGEPFIADRIHEILSTSSDFTAKSIAECQALVNQGTLIFAALPSIRLGQQHGHVVSLTPGKEDYSATWDCKTPLAMNIGATNFRARGIQWAFPVAKGIPDLFAWVPSL